MAEDTKVLNVLIPIAGKAQRFADQGYNMPKPLIMVDGKCILDHAMKCISGDIPQRGKVNFIFVVRRDHVQKYGIDKVIKEKFSHLSVKIVIAESDTEGALCTCLLAKDLIDKHEPLLIFTPDIKFSPVIYPRLLLDSELEGIIYTFKANSEAHSYAQLDEDGFVIKTAEKEVISQNAAVGVYFFKSGANFVHHAESSVNNKEKVKNEYYICPLYNKFIEEGAKIVIQELTRVHVLGTPEDVEFYETHAKKYDSEKPFKIGVCADHSGFDAKELVKSVLRNKLNFDKTEVVSVVDYGTYVDIPCDYSDYAKEACEGIRRGEVDIVIGFCRTGNGVNMCANNQEGIISALVRDEYTAEHAVTHNCANFFAVPSKDIFEIDSNDAEDRMFQITSEIIGNFFEGGRHATRLRKFL